MKNTVLPDLDMETIERLKQRFPDLSNVDLPKMESVGKSADQTIDKLLGRSRAPIWPWIAGAFALVAIIGTVAAYLGWLRRPPMDSIDTTGADSLATDATNDAFNGTESYGSDVDRTWPSETTSEVRIGSEEV